MSHKLIIYPDPLDALCQLQHDSGFTIDGVADSNDSGRKGQSFTIPDTVPNGWGCRLVISAPKKISLIQRGILYYGEDENAAFYADDFHLVDVPPPVIIEVPVPPTVPPPSTVLTPYQIIQGVFAIGKYNLGTKEGCGQFTEACVVALHEANSNQWGNIRKIPPQNNYNGHAVDAIMLLTGSLVPAGTFTKAGIYDIIQSSESPEAKPVMNWVGEPDPNKWYYA